MKVKLEGGELHIDLYEALRYLSVEEKRQVADTLACQDDVIELVAQQIITGWTEFDSHDKWIFPSWSAAGRYMWPKEAWHRIRTRAGLNDLRMHDLRRTLGSWQACQGSSLQIIGKSLGHSSTRATLLYARLHLDPVRESVERATAAIEAVRKKSEKAGKSPRG